MTYLSKLVSVPFIFALFYLTSSCMDAEKSAASSENVLGPFMGMTPTDTPRLLNPVQLASTLEEYNGTFNPDGTEFFYTINTPDQGIICYSKMDETGRWSDPRVADFSGEASEYDPLFSPDGERLYISSRRRVNQESYDRCNIWMVERTDSGWGEPTYVDLKGYGNFYSSLTSDGSMYFNVWNNGDMFKATFGDSTRIERLPDVLNSDNGEGDPFISPNEDYLIYRGYYDTKGRGDLYISFLKEGSKSNWSEPQSLGEPINSPVREMCPYVTADGKFFIWASARVPEAYQHKAGASLSAMREQHRTIFNGEQNIYYISADFVEKFRTTAIFP